MESRLPASDRIAQLIAAGFQNTGHWQLDTEGVVRFVGQAPADPGVYAFTVNDEVCYIGSAQRGLRRRLRKYDNIRNKGLVATRVRAQITEALKLGADVRVLTVICSPIFWQGLPIDPIAGLEEGLIRELQPRWNIRGLAGLRRRATQSN